MRTRGLFVALGLLLLVNALVLAGVRYNRSGDPDAVLTLTERELPVAHRFQKENSGISLSINTQHYYYRGRGPFTYEPFAWLDRKKLEAIGFAFPATADKNEDSGYYNRQLPRKAYVVLEYDGPAWEAWKKRLTDELAEVNREALVVKRSPKELEAEQKNIERALKTGSHLFSIDAGHDPATLRQAYPDRQHYLILPAKIRVSWYGGAKNDNIRGYVEILTPEVNVPHRLHANLKEQGAQDGTFRYGTSMLESEPRYRAVLSTGKRYEPWIEDIVSMPH